VSDDMMMKLKGLFELMRFELPFAAGICVILGQLFALGFFAPFTLSLLAFFSVFTISASILVLNDYLDLETDIINAPQRPIPSGIVSKKESLLLTVLLIFFGLYFSYLISIIAFATIIFLLIIGNLYNRFFKKSGLLGNLIVSISVGMTFIFGGISVGEPFNKTVIFFALIAALIDLGEEIAADAMDIEGDKLINSKSIAIKYGRVKAVKTSSIIFSIVLLLSPVPFFLGWFSFIYLIPIGIMDLFILYSTIKLIKSQQNSEGRKYIRLLYIGSTFGLVIFLVMKMLKL
jgi:geranylgeranylglycerol-phosphate geranylgeranyltransferase